MSTTHGGWVQEVKFNADQEQRVKAVCRHDAFLQRLQGIATWYSTHRLDDLSAPGIEEQRRAAAAVFRAVGKLQDALSKAPTPGDAAIIVGLHDRALKEKLRETIAGLKPLWAVYAALERDLTAPRGRPPSVLEHEAAIKTRDLFVEHGLDFDRGLPGAEDRSAAVQCLQVVFESASRPHVVAILTIADYIRAAKAEIARREG